MIEFPDFNFDLKFRPYTLGGAQFWADVYWRANWRIQRNASAENYRLLDPKNRLVDEGTLAHCHDALLAEAPPDNPQRLILMLHGLLATWRFLAPCRRYFAARGLDCALINYPSTRADLDTHGKRLARLIADMPEVTRLDAVTHSMGGLVLANAVSQPIWPAPNPLRKVVMIAPPLRGAAMARMFAQVKLLHPIVGPPLTFLQTGEGAPELPEDIDLMVVAGIRGKPGGFNPLLEGDDDGTVAVKETRPRRPHVFKTVRGQHTLLNHSKKTHALAYEFITT
ncbi:MAG: alpha/beta hydrolase [Pseudomonadota bacterium]